MHYIDAQNHELLCGNLSDNFRFKIVRGKTCIKMSQGWETDQLRKCVLSNQDNLSSGLKYWHLKASCCPLQSHLQESAFDIWQVSGLGKWFLILNFFGCILGRILFWLVLLWAFSSIKQHKKSFLVVLILSRGFSSQNIPFSFLMTPRTFSCESFLTCRLSLLS